MDVSVIIVNYNTQSLTDQAIKSVYQKTQGISFELILIDNDSSDGSQNHFEKLTLPNFKFIKSESNLGFGRANNLGIDQASGRYLFLLNSDTLLINNAIKILADFMDKNNQVGVCGGNLFYEDGSAAHSFYRALPSLKEDFKDIFFIRGIQKTFFNHNIEFNFTEKPLEVGYITGADMMIRRSCLEKSGWFDPDFFMYYEEAELTHRISTLGNLIFSVPQAKITHLEGKSFQYKSSRTRMIYTSRYLYFKKVYGKKSMFWSYLIFNFILLTRFLTSFNSDYLNMLKINKETYKASH